MIALFTILVNHSRIGYTTAMTEWKIYTTSQESLDAMMAACEKAQKSIDFEQFIFVDDTIGRQFINTCIEAAKRGVRVRFIWDAAGSFSFFGSVLAEELKGKGIELIFFKTLIPGFFNVHNYRSWYFRNHRRTLVIDGTIGFTGGIGVWEKMQNWRDTLVEIRGPVVSMMQDEFEQMWNRALKRNTPRAQRDRSAKRRKRLERLQRKMGRKFGFEKIRQENDFIYETNSPLPKQRRIYYALLDAIRGAEKNIYITSPYFVPTRVLAKLLRTSAERGLDVHIVIPAVSDHPLVDLAARSYFEHLLEAGVHIHLYKGNMIHSKTVIIDDVWTTVGTLNMDTISLLYNFEANLISTNARFATELKALFFEDIRQSEAVDPQVWNRRIFLQKIPEYFVRFLRKFL